MKQLTLTYLIKDRSVCLGLKKRGFGKGKWNGFGGKVEEGESMLEGAVREVLEESGVSINPEELKLVAIIEFLFPNGEHLDVHTYFSRTFEGEPKETEEMKPKWFLFKDIPYAKMWEDDIHWLPRALKGEKLKGVVWFDEAEKIHKMEWSLLQ